MKKNVRKSKVFWANFSNNTANLRTDVQKYFLAAVKVLCDGLVQSRVLETESGMFLLLRVGSAPLDAFSRRMTSPAGNSGPPGWNPVCWQELGSEFRGQQEADPVKPDPGGVKAAVPEAGGFCL